MQNAAPVKIRLVPRAEVKEEQKDGKTDRASGSKGEVPKRRVTFKEEPIPEKKSKTETPQETREYQDRKPVATTGSQNIEDDL